MSPRPNVNTCRATASNSNELYLENCNSNKTAILTKGRTYNYKWHCGRNKGNIGIKIYLPCSAEPMPIKDLEEHFIKLFVLYVEMTWLLQCNYRVSYSCAESYHGVQPMTPQSPHNLTPQFGWLYVWSGHQSSQCFTEWTLFKTN